LDPICFPLTEINYRLRILIRAFVGSTVSQFFSFGEVLSAPASAILPYHP